MSDVLLFWAMFDRKTREGIGGVSFHDELSPSAKSQISFSGSMKEPSTLSLSFQRDLQRNDSSYRSYSDMIPQVPFSPAIRTDRSHRSLDPAGPSLGGKPSIASVSGTAALRLKAADL